MEVTREEILTLTISVFYHVFRAEGENEGCCKIRPFEALTVITVKAVTEIRYSEKSPVREAFLLYWNIGPEKRVTIFFFFMMYEYVSILFKFYFFLYYTFLNIFFTMTLCYIYFKKCHVLLL